MPNSAKFLRGGAAIHVLLLACAPCPAATAEPAIALIDQLPVDIASDSVSELSGITFAGADQFYAVSDRNSTLVPLTIQIDPASGKIGGYEFGKPVVIRGVTDLEGVAYDSRDGSVLVAAEGEQEIKRVNPKTGEHLGWIDTPAIFKKARNNFGLESLTLNTQNLHLWTANEEALTVDGPRSTDEAGSVVRLQRFDQHGKADQQFAYRTDPHPGKNRINDRIGERSGVSELLALPSGHVLVLERALGGLVIPQLRIRIYLIDFEQATDTSDLTALEDADFTTVTKKQLLQIDAGFRNYEGIALGPRLDNGDYSLILISDDGGKPETTPQSLLPLRISGVAMPGDLNGDFQVDHADLQIVLNAWGDDVPAGKWIAGDPSGDGKVDEKDLDIVRQGWSVAGEPPAASPPSD